MGVEKLMGSKALRLSLTLALAFVAGGADGAPRYPHRFAVTSDDVRRVYEQSAEGEGYRTVWFERSDQSSRIEVESDEFLIVLLDGTELTVDDYCDDGRIAGDGPNISTTGIPYKRRADREYPPDAPVSVFVSYAKRGGERYLRKHVSLTFDKPTSIDRLEVERFVTKAPTERGGRGEPVFIDDEWFIGVEFPAAYSRHGDGNQPVVYSGHYDRVGNYSFIDLEGHDIEKNPREGLVRLFHFPGPARQTHSAKRWYIKGKTTVCGVGNPGDPMELVFFDYLDTIRRPVRSFLHYNNWYDTDGKNLKKENFVDNVHAAFKKNLEPYGVRIDAMVPDNGWQDKGTIYQPNPAQFPNGDADLKALGEALRANGSGLGLWMSLNSYTSRTDKLAEQGYPPAVVNKHFSRFKTISSLAAPKYFAEISRRLPELIELGQVTYIKHDFNTLCDMGPDNDTLPTDRHGHERALEREIELLEIERKANPDIYQNVTNWIWFSPWWLEHGNNVWMLSGDSGVNRAWPQISTRRMAITYRDSHIQKMWGSHETRPLVPISHLMTHGMIYGARKKVEKEGDTLQDWSDYVVMYHGRGVQLKEWYITPRLMTPERWKVLGRATRWAEAKVETLANSIYIGGDPATGATHGYMCWDGDDGVLTCRNPSPQEQTLTVPFDKRVVWYRGDEGRDFRGEVVYPYRGEMAEQFVSGKPMEIAISGYSTMVVHFAPGKAKSAKAAHRAVNLVARSGVVTVPKDAKRCDLLVTLRGKDAGEAIVRVDGKPLEASRTNEGKGADGPWKMVAFDLLPFAGKKVVLEPPREGESWIVADVLADKPSKEEDELPWALDDGYRRVTAPLVVK